MKKIGILTGGGDVQPLNTVIETVRQKSFESNIELIGFLEGWKGLLEKKYVDLTHKKINKNIGGTILKSSRVNLKNIENVEDKIKKNIDKLRIDGLIIIGGEDTLSNSFYLGNIPQVLISKTIDNDVGVITEEEIINHFTLGHPTAAEKISSFVSLSQGVRTTAYSHKRIIVVESMGMHAGWLAMSSALGFPDFIIIPEFGLNYSLLLDLVKERYAQNENVIIVISEGAKWASGKYISADESQKDEFGHPKFIGAASTLASKLKNDLTGVIETRNINYVNPSYLYRSGKPNKLDQKSSEILGKEAVSKLKNGLSKSMFLAVKINNKSIDIEEIFLDEISNINNFHRFIPEHFYNSEIMNVTDSYLQYLKSFNLFNESQMNYSL